MSEPTPEQERIAAGIVAGRAFDRNVAISGGSWTAAIAAALAEAEARGRRGGEEGATELLAAAEGATERYMSYLTSGEGPRQFIPSMDRLCQAIRKIKAGGAGGGGK